MEPEDIAEIVFNRVKESCDSNSGYSKLKCMANHSPERLDKFIDVFLTNEESRELKKAIENSGQFWDDVVGEYGARWRYWFPDKIGELLGDEIELTIYSIIENRRLDNPSKVRRLEAYDAVIGKLYDAIKHALKERRPLTRNELYNLFAELGDIAFGTKNRNYYDEIERYLSYYDMLDKDKKLMMYELLLEYINHASHIAFEESRRLEVLVNSS